jgi:alkylation response protein AidB-like acyl-CoA dehydrogenase
MNDFDDAQWAELLDEARAGVRQRESDRLLPHDLLRRLLELGLGRARVPVSEGGLGWSLRETFSRLIELAASDSHLAHVFRGHLVLLEEEALFGGDDARRRWQQRAVRGEFIGNAQSERDGTAGATEQSVTLDRDEDGRLFVTGTKYYTTGSIYADWIDLSVKDGDDTVLVTVSTHQDGVASVDDWDGFGQELTGSGTTRFDRALVDTADVRVANWTSRSSLLRQGLFQLVLLAVVAGIGDGALRETTAYVLQRKRLFGRLDAVEVREDPVVQQTLGHISAGVFSARTLVLALAEEWDGIVAAELDGSASDEDFDRGRLNVFRIQGEIIDRVLSAVNEIFEVGGASEVTRGLGLDRFWRDARTIASHNPLRQRQRIVGAAELGIDLAREREAAAAQVTPAT